MPDEKKIEEVSLGTLMSLAEAIGKTKGAGKRFDYDGIRNELVKLGQSGIAVTSKRVKLAMKSHDSRGGIVHGPQVRKCIEMLDARKDTKALVVPDTYPRLYLFKQVRKKIVKESK